MKGRMILSLLTLSLVLSGCNGNANDQYRVQDEDYYTNQNPNFIDLTENRPDIGDDQDKFVETIEEFTDYRPGSVFVSGANAYVTVHTTESLSEEEKQKEEKKLHKTLRKAMPRYHIRVTIHDND
ncbi:hypothetical protein [Bacillus sp. PS06]|uniref:hypothetical protein n=1 Tax=Bacillus sp. PS06 TaxID=2764176 RepID=UPI001785276A|nr:hypothetical protein [Bacillus sp. PS06]MBD8071356.1 hypothetical protein [Bacillus sp. PS06]